jgi:hypothetical protein
MAAAKTMWHHIIKNREGQSHVTFASFWDFENMEFRCFENSERPNVSFEETKRIIAQEEGDVQGQHILKMTADYGKTSKATKN